MLTQPQKDKWIERLRNPVLQKHQSKEHYFSGGCACTIGHGSYATGLLVSHFEDKLGDAITNVIIKLNYTYTLAEMAEIVELYVPTNEYAPLEPIEAFMNSRA